MDHGVITNVCEKPSTIIKKSMSALMTYRIGSDTSLRAPTHGGTLSELYSDATTSRLPVGRGGIIWLLRYYS